MSNGLVISVMLAVADAPAAVAWYKRRSVLPNFGTWEESPVCRYLVLPSLLESQPTMDGKVLQSLALLQQG